MKKISKIVCVISLAFIFLCTLSLYQGHNNQLSAEEINQVGLAIDQVVPTAGNCWRTYGRKTGNGWYALGKDHTLYTVTPGAKSQQVRTADGDIFTGIEKIYTNVDRGYYTEAMPTTFFAKMLDGSYYAWGTGSYGEKYGTNNIGGNPTKVDPSVLPSGNIKDIVLGSSNSFLIMDNGDVYAAGRNRFGELGDGTNSASPTFKKIDNLSAIGITQIRITGQATTDYGESLIALDATGKAYSWGKDAATHGKDLYVPTPIKEDETTEFSIPIKEISYMFSSTDTSGTFSFVTTDNSLYYVGSQSSSVYQCETASYNVGGKCHWKNAVSYPTKSDFISLPGEVTFMGDSSFSFFAIIDGKFYLKEASRAGSDYAERYQGIIGSVTKLAQYFDPLISLDTKIKYAAITLDNVMILTESGRLYVHDLSNESKELIVTPSVSVIGNKKENNSIYTLKEKYNKDITLTASIDKTTYPTRNLVYKICDVNGAVCGEEIDTGDTQATISIEAVKDTLINKGYKFYVQGKETEAYNLFVVDLYNKDIDTSGESVQDGDVLSVDDYVSLSWKDTENVLSGNTITRKLQAPGASSPSEYVGGTELTELGDYVYTLSDTYGNEASINFALSDKPIPRVITFTPNGSLVYDTENTKVNGTLGTLALEYDPDKQVSSIDTISITDGNTEEYFRVVKDTLYAEKTIPAGIYTLQFSGTDTNGAKFKDLEVKIEIAKANDPITWDEDTSSTFTKGIYYGDSFTLGVHKKSNELDVTFKQTSENPNVIINETTGEITISNMNGNTMTIDVEAIPSNSTNYELTSIKGSFTITKHQLKLKTVLGVNDSDQESISLADALPSFKVLSDATLPDGVSLPTPTFALYDGDTKISDLVKAGTYEIRAEYEDGALDTYDVQWTYGKLIVTDVTITPDNVSDFYSLTIDDDVHSPYVPGTWANHVIKIEPKHTTFNSISIDGGIQFSNASDVISYDIEGDKTVSMILKNQAGARTLPIDLNLKYDKTAPELTDFSYTDVPVLSEGTVPFDKLFSKAQTITFASDDGVDGSGIKAYHYTIQEVDKQGTAVGASKTGDGDKIDLDVDKNYKITVIAEDQAGNTSAAYTETIMIDSNIPELQLKATHSPANTPYDGTSWTRDEIKIEVSCDGDITEYEYSIDGINFLPLETPPVLTIPNTANINDVTYTFRGTTLTGLRTSKELQIKMDVEVPEIEINAISNGHPIVSGDVTEYDVEMTPTSKTDNPSGVSYYYTTKEEVSATDPTSSDSKWETVSDHVTATENGVAIYYFKAVSGAGKVSSLTSFTVDLQKKEYTPITPEAVSNDKAYTGEWTNQNVEISLHGGLKDEELLTGYEYCVTDGANPTGEDVWQAMDSTLTLQDDQKEQYYWFRVDADGLISNSVIVNIDKTAPIMTAITYKDKENTLLEDIINSITFNNYFKDAQTASFEASDTLSGIKDFTYTLSILNDDGTIRSAGSPTRGDSVDLAKDTNYKLEVIATDEAGNESTTPFVHIIKINEKIGNFDMEVKTEDTQKPYTGEWTSKAILVQLTSIDEIKNYEYSLDGTTFIPLEQKNSYKIDNSKNRNGEILYFRGTNTKNETSMQSITVYMDIQKPEVIVTGNSNGDTIQSGEIASQDVKLSLQNGTENISKEVFYYTKDSAIAKLDPRDPESGWLMLSNKELLLTENESSTYYFVAVSGANVVSDIQEFDVSLQKKVYTKPIVSGMSDGKTYTSGMWAKNDVTLEVTGGLEDTSMITSYEYTTTSSPSTLPDQTSIWKEMAMNDNKGTISIAKETQGEVYWFRIDASSPYISSPFIVKLDTTEPVITEIKLTYKNTDGLSQFLNMITFGAWFNQEIEAEVITSDNFSEEKDRIVETQEVKDGIAGSWTKYSGKIPYGDGTNIVLYARVQDAAGNVSKEAEGKNILLDLSAPIIHGVDNGNTYHIMRHVTLEDSVSGINEDASYYVKNTDKQALKRSTNFKEKGKVNLHVEDNAGNTVEVSFEILPLPEIDDLTDSDEDYVLIDKIEEEYKEVKDHMSEQEQKEYEDWLDKAKKKIKRYISEVKEPQSNIIVSGLDDTKFEEDVELVVEIITSEIKVEEISLTEVAGLDEKTELKEVYDIYLKKGDEIISIPENGSVKVMIPYTEERKGIENLKVIYIDKEFKSTLYPHKIETINNTSYITFVTTHFSHYALVGDKADKDLNKDVDGDGNPDINITKPGEDRPYLNIDTDHDDRPDVNVDLDGDMEADINIDTTGDFVPDVDIDSDGDGKPEINLDVNGDGIADKNIVEIKQWIPDQDVNSPILYDTMGNIKYVEDTKNPADGNAGSGDGENPSNGTSVQGNYNKGNTTIGGANTGEATQQIAFLWILTILSGIVSVGSILYKKRKI